MKDSDLDQLLKATNATFHAHPEFQRNVWHRIQSAEATGWGWSASSALRRFLDFLAVPPVAVATCTLLIAMGALLGLRTEATPEGGESAYVKSISPFVQSHR